MSSCQSIPDPRDLGDADYVPATASQKPAGTLTLSSYLGGVKLTHTAPELSRTSAGMESFARVLTCYNRDLYDSQLLQKPIVTTANKLRSAVEIDGRAKLKMLNEMIITGIILLYMAKN